MTLFKFINQSDLRWTQTDRIQIEIAYQLKRLADWRDK